MRGLELEVSRIDLLRKESMRAERASLSSLGVVSTGGGGARWGACWRLGRVVVNARRRVGVKEADSEMRGRWEARRQLEDDGMKA